jgi:hypothetical protein
MAIDVFGDFQFVGGDNTPANPFQDRQVAINWYPELSPSKASKTVASLLGCPGLIQLLAAPGGGAPGFSTSMTAWPQPYSGPFLPVRGFWVLPGRTQALAVISNVCYLITIASAGSITVPAVLNMTSVGTLNSNNGVVHIRDNGIGGYAVVVDGPNYYLYNRTTQTLALGTDPAWLGSNTVAFIDGWWVFQQPGTPKFYTNAAPYSTALNASLFNLKDAFSDNLMAVAENKEELWLPGESTTEIWYNAGGQYFPFQRLVGTLLQVGCKAVHSISRLTTAGQDGLIWFGRSERGENVFVRTQGFVANTVSTPAVSDEIATYTTTADCIGYTYQEDTHEFAVFNFPTADRTWVYDASMPPELAWHRRLSYDPYAAQFHRHRSNCFMNFAGIRIVGDYQNGAIYQLTRAVQNDAGWPMYGRRRAPMIWDKETRGRVFMSSLQVDFAPGQGASAGLGANPTANLTISRDAGASLGTAYEPAPSNTFPAPMGAIGQTLNRTIWRKLGWSRGAVAQLDVIAPVNRDISGATLEASGSP